MNDRPLSVDAYVPLIATTFLDNLSDSWSIPHSRIEEKSCWLLKQRQHASCALSCTRLAFANRATGELSTDQYALNEARSTRSRTRRARCDARWLRYARWLRSVRRVHGEGVHLRMYASQKHDGVRVRTARFRAHTLALDAPAFDATACSTRSRTRRARCDARWLRYARWLRSAWRRRSLARVRKSKARESSRLHDTILCVPSLAARSTGHNSNALLDMRRGS